MILNKKTRRRSIKLFNEVVSLGVDFKLQENVSRQKINSRGIRRILTDLPIRGTDINAVLKEFKKNILPYCTNFSSSKFLGFPDSGNSVAALAGSILYNFLQQNLINQSFCAPSATFVEIAVLQWLRETIGYSDLTKKGIKDIWDVGGIITSGGTASNTVAMMLARENKKKGTLDKGITNPDQFRIIVPAGTGHYSVKSAQMWIGCGHNLIEVPTKNFRYDLTELRKALLSNKGKVMALVAYVGDSRTMTVDNMDAIADLVHSIDKSIWLHADACHGFSLGFSKKLKPKIKGVERFDSVSTDPHKVLLTPYTISGLLVKDPASLRTITSISDLIMREEFAFGQVTPFLGSKSWNSLMLWFMMKNFGKRGLDKLVTDRHNLALSYEKKLRSDSDFQVLNDVDINAVVFFFIDNGRLTDIDLLNTVNKTIHERILQDGKYHFHQFSIPDQGIFKKGAVIYPLRFMCGNPNVTEHDLKKSIDYLRKVGRGVVKEQQKNG